MRFPTEHAMLAFGLLSLCCFVRMDLFRCACRLVSHLLFAVQRRQRVRGRADAGRPRTGPGEGATGKAQTVRTAGQPGVSTSGRPGQACPGRAASPPAGPAAAPETLGQAATRYRGTCTL